MGARLYVPSLGRFLTVDPIKGGTQNDYVYPSDPIGSNDFSGNWAFLIPIAIGVVSAIFTGLDAKDCASGDSSGCDSLALTALTGGMAGAGRRAGKLAVNELSKTATKAPSRVSKMSQIVGGNINVSITSVAAAQATSKSLGAAAIGRDVHELFMVGKGGLKETRLSSGRRPDYIDTTNRIVYELKLNNPKALALGEKQAQRYVDEINNVGLIDVISGPGTQPFTYQIITYTIK